MHENDYGDLSIQLLTIRIKRAVDRHHPCFIRCVLCGLMCVTVLLVFWLSPHLMTVLNLPLSDCPDSSRVNSSSLTSQLSPAISLSSNSSSVPSSHGSHPAVLVVSKAENGGNLSFKEFHLPPVQTKPSLSSPSLLSDDASSGVCETVAPPDGLKDLFFTFNNLSSCNLSSMVEQFSESV